MTVLRGSLLALCLTGIAGPVLATDAIETPVRECQSCNARHNALQNLQESRTGAEDAQSKAKETLESTDNSALTTLPPAPLENND